MRHCKSVKPILIHIKCCQRLRHKKRDPHQIPKKSLQMFLVIQLMHLNQFQTAW